MSSDIRRLPSFGSPNEFPNPPTHFFPSKPGAFAARRAAQQQAQAQAINGTSAPTNNGRDHHTNGQAQYEAAPRSSTSSLRSRDRVTWDAGSEFMRDEQSGAHHRKGQGSDETVKTLNAITSNNKRKTSPEQDDELDEDIDGDGDGGEGDGDGGDDTMDGATTGDSPTQSGAGKEAGASSKKRSRTLTTAHQTAVLNALLAKTRFPSTETREEVGKEIGMSARRVQIWFQNRRQSQKRARDREATEMGSSAGAQHAQYDMYYMHNPPQAGQMQHQYHHHQQQQQQQQQQRSPYGQHHPFPGPPSTSTASTARPAVNRHTSMDSIGSYASAHSSVSSFHTPSVHHSRDSYPADHGSRWPGPGNPPPMSYGPGWQYSPGVQSSSSELGSRSGAYFPSHFPPAPRALNRPVVEDTPLATTGDSVRLPSLSAVLGPALSDAPEGPFGASSSSARSNFFPSAIRSQPSDRAGSGPGGRSILSPTPTSASRPIDESGFARLRISSEAPLSPPPAQLERHARQTSPPDVLDAAMETMYRPTNINPPRSSLPPLRMPSTHRRSVHSEADAALSAPILPAVRANQRPSGTERTQSPSISTLTGGRSVFPSQPDAVPRDPPKEVGRTQRQSQQYMHTIPVGGSLTTWTTSSARYEQPTPTSPASSLPPPPPSGAPTRSSVSSVDTSTGWAWNAPPAGITAARTDSILAPSRESVSSASGTSSIGTGVGGSSFSHEVQEEWARISSSGNGVRKVVPAQVVESGAGAGAAGQVDAEGDVTMG